MHIDRSEILDGKAKELMSWMIEQDNHYHSFGSVSASIYDTAWLSMVSKRVDGELQWLFPEAFQYVLSSQEASGGWISDNLGSKIDCILTSMAALLALRRHASAPGPSSGLGEDLLRKTYHGAAFVQTLLQSWDVESTLHVGFELLVSTLLDLLQEEGLVFSFPGRQMLLQLKDKKITKLRPEMLYNDNKATSALIHSLEAFAGTIDFNKVAHHKVYGGMMGSPAATAAYLIYSSSWDDEAENYLRDVVSAGSGKKNGSVPTAWPTPFFEISWVIATLFIGGFDVQKLGGKPLHDILHSAFENGSGLAGFAPLVESDADMTAKSITALGFLGTFISVEPMVKYYEGEEYFKTYPYERDPSLSANCNILIALLNTPRPIDFRTQIEKIVRYLCKSWDKREVGLRDKWNVSPLYTTMLMSQGLVELLAYKANGRVFAESLELAEQEILFTLCEALTCTLQTQSEDGSWDNSREATAYAVLTINALQSLLIASSLKSQVDSAIVRARQYLWSQLDSDKVEYLWIAKIRYATYTISQAYVLAALHCSAATNKLPQPPKNLLGNSKPSELAKLYSEMPLLSTIPEWRIQAWQAQAHFYSLRVRHDLRSLFPRKIADGKRHIDFLYFATVAANNINQQAPLGSGIILSMLILFSHAYEVDEIIEGSAALQSESYLSELKNKIERLFDVDGMEHDRGLENPDSCLDASTTFSGSTTGPDHSMTTIPGVTQKNDVHVNHHDQSRDRHHDAHEVNVLCPAEINESLSRFFRNVLFHPMVQKASKYEKEKLRINLQQHLLAMLIQIQDSRQLQGKEHDQSTTGTAALTLGSYSTWVRGTGMYHGGSPLHFSFLLCLLGKSTDCFQTSEAKFIADDFCLHLSTLGRILNDLSSIDRDRAEGNLNSADFAEFRSGQGDISDGALKERLLRVAEYERRCRDMALAELKDVCEDRRVYDAAKFLSNVTDIFGEMYLLVDLNPFLGDRGNRQ